jgi:hypothetical protein
MKMIQRVVCFRFKPGTETAEIARHMNSFRHMQEGIPQIQSYAGGLALTEPDEDEPEYQAVHYLTFKNAEEMDVYAGHPVHLAFIEENRAIWEKVLVINSPTEG